MPGRRIIFFKILSVICILFFFSVFVFAEEITSPSFKIEGDTVSGGSGEGKTINFGLVGDINPFAGLSDSANFREEIGYTPRIQAYTPYPPVLENTQNYYDRLKIKVNLSNNNLNTIFAVIVSTDNFVTYKYVQNDGTLGDTLGTEDYKDYNSWGAAEGSYILGLTQNTAYKAKAKALNGDFTETGYSGSSNEVTTTVPFVKMTVSQSAITLGTLNVNSISQTTSVGVAVTTNAYTGYQVYVHDQGNGASGGLFNPQGSLILSADMTLTPGVAGYGAQANSATALVDDKYNKLGNTVGGLTTSLLPLFSNYLAVNSENTTVMFKATMSPTTTAGEYADQVFFTVTPNL